VVEAALTVSGPSPTEMVAGLRKDPFVLLDAVVRGVMAAAFADEAVFRTVVRVTVDRWFAAQETRAGLAAGSATPPAQEPSVEQGPCARHGGSPTSGRLSTPSTALWSPSSSTGCLWNRSSMTKSATSVSATLINAASSAVSRFSPAVVINAPG
jgi:hypothetical protein